MSELRIVKEEGRQLRIRMVGVYARQIAALNTRWSHVTIELTSRQNTLATRIGRIKGHINNIARDQNDALESSQAMWRSMQELQAE